MSYLEDSTARFKKQVAEQTVLARPKPRTASSAQQPAGQPRAKTEDTAGRKAQKKTPASYPQSTETTTARHTMSQLLNVINFLKERVDQPQTVEDLMQNNIDINANPELYRHMVNNEKILYDPANKTFKYKPEYQIRTNDDLYRLLESRKDQKPCGMLFKDLFDSYADVTTSINELENDGRVLVIRMMKDNAPRLLFWNDAAENTHMDQEFRDMFHKVVTPDEVDLAKELTKAGLQTMAILENPTQNETKPKTRKRKAANRKLKITNTHLKDLDLTKDYTPQKK